MPQRAVSLPLRSEVNVARDIFPPMTVNPPGYLGDDDMLGGASRSKQAVARRKQFNKGRINRGPGLNVNARAPFPIYLPTHGNDPDGIGESLGFAPVLFAAPKIAGAAKNALTDIFGHPKDASRQATNNAAYAAAQGGDRNAWLFLKAMSGHYGPVAYGSWGSTPGGTGTGWGTVKERVDADNKYKALAARFGVSAGQSVAQVAPGAPTGNAQAAIYGTAELSPSSLPNTADIANKVATDSQAVARFAQVVADSTGGTPPDGSGLPSGGTASAPGAAQSDTSSLFLYAALAGGAWLLFKGRGRSRRR